MANVEQKTSTLFSLWVQDVSTAYDKLDADIDAQIKRMKMLGLSDREIFDRLTASLNEESDIFSVFKGAIGRSNDTLVNMVSQVESNETLREVAEMFIWELDPTAKDHCETCKTNSLKGEMTFDNWEELGLPGYGNTDCGRYCRCTLIPVRNK